MWAASRVNSSIVSGDVQTHVFTPIFMDALRARIEKAGGAPGAARGGLIDGNALDRLSRRILGSRRLRDARELRPRRRERDDGRRRRAGTWGAPWPPEATPDETERNDERSASGGLLDADGTASSPRLVRLRVTWVSTESSQSDIPSGGRLVLSRTRRCIGNTVRPTWPDASMLANSVRHAARPISRIGCAMVVNAGRNSSPCGRPSNPTIERSAGIRRPRCCATRRKPKASASLASTTAVASRGPSSHRSANASPAGVSQLPHEYVRARTEAHAGFRESDPQRREGDGVSRGNGPDRPRRQSVLWPSVVR